MKHPAAQAEENSRARQRNAACAAINPLCMRQSKAPPAQPRPFVDQPCPCRSATLIGCPALTMRAMRSGKQTAAMPRLVENRKRRRGRTARRRSCGDQPYQPRLCRRPASLSPRPRESARRSRPSMVERNHVSPSAEIARIRKMAMSWSVTYLPVCGDRPIPALAGINQAQAIPTPAGGNRASSHNPEAPPNEGINHGNAQAPDGNHEPPPAAQGISLRHGL